MLDPQSVYTSGNPWRRTSRRAFLRRTAALLSAPAATSVLAACGRPRKDSSMANDSTGSAAPADVGLAAVKEERWREMDRMHQAGVKAFPAETEGLGGLSLAPKTDGNVKVFELTARKVQWEVEPGKHVEAWTYNGTLPGPEIRVTEGDRVRVVLRNELDESTAIHFHGQATPNAMDGVPFITQDPIPPGGTFTYEFVAKPFGSHMYHSHHNSALQVSRGLLGAFIVGPRDRSAEPRADAEWTIILNDMAHGYTLNGKSFPATQPFKAKLGQRVRIRFMNEGMMIHPMHLHGMPLEVFAKDGYVQPAPWKCDTLNVAPGERWDAIVACDNPGVWALHCHILSHAESEHGMFGMVTALIVEA